MLLTPLLTFQQQWGHSSEAEPSKETVQLPDPLNLNSSWWSYLDVSGDELVLRASQLKSKLDEQFSSLVQEEHEVIHQLIDNIKFNLDILVKKSQKAADAPQSLLQLLNAYTDKQLLDVNANLHQIKTKLENSQDKLDLQKTQITMHKRSMDDLLSLYQHSSPSSFLRLKTGMEILNHRLELANLEAELQKTKQKISFYREEHENLAKELEIAQEKLFFDNQAEQGLKKSIEQAAKAYQNSVNTLHQLRKKSFYEEEKDPNNELVCCLWNYKVINQAVLTQINKVKLMIEEIKYALFSVATQPDQASTNDIKSKVKSWNEQLERVHTHLNNWKHFIDDEQTRVGTEVAQALQNPELSSANMNSVVTETHFNLDQITSNIQKLEILQDNAMLLNRQIDSVLIKEKTLMDTWWLRIQRFFQESLDTFYAWTNFTVFRINESPVTILNLLGALLIIIFSMVISGYIRRIILQKQYISKNLSQATKYILSRCIHYIFIVLGFCIALSFIGIDFTNFVIIAGALGVGIGFGLQTMVNNIISGFLLLFQRMIKVDDIVELDNGIIGNVKAINLQNTHIRSFEGIDLIVPNNKMTSDILKNWTFHDRCRRFKIPFDTAYGCDKDLVKNVVIEAAKKLPNVKHGDPRYADPQVWLTQLGDNALIFELVVWVDLNIKIQDCGSASSALLWEIETALTANNISIPFPQRDIYIKEFPGVPS